MRIKVFIPYPRSEKHHALHARMRYCEPSCMFVCTPSIELLMRIAPVAGQATAHISIAFVPYYPVRAIMYTAEQYMSLLKDRRGWRTLCRLLEILSNLVPPPATPNWDSVPRELSHLYPQEFFNCVRITILSLNPCELKLKLQRHSTSWLMSVIRTKREQGCPGKL